MDVFFSILPFVAIIGLTMLFVEVDSIRTQKKEKGRREKEVRVMERLKELYNENDRLVSQLIDIEESYYGDKGNRYQPISKKLNWIQKEIASYEKILGDKATVVLDELNKDDERNETNKSPTMMDLMRKRMNEKR